MSVIFSTINVVPLDCWNASRSKLFSERWCSSEDGALAGLTLALGTSMGLSWVQNFVQTTDLANLVHLHDQDDHDQDVFHLLDVPLDAHPLLPHGQLGLSWTNINCATLRGESIFLYHNNGQYHNYFDYYDGQYVSKMWQHVKSDNLVRNQPLKGFWRTLCWSTWSAAFHNMTIVIVIVVIDRIDKDDQDDFPWLCLRWSTPVCHQLLIIRAGAGSTLAGWSTSILSFTLSLISFWGGSALI